MRSSVTSDIRKSPSDITHRIAESAERTVGFLDGTDFLNLTPRQSVALPMPLIATFSNLSTPAYDSAVYFSQRIVLLVSPSALV